MPSLITAIASMPVVFIIVLIVVMAIGDYLEGN